MNEMDKAQQLAEQMGYTDLSEDNELWLTKQAGCGVGLVCEVGVINPDDRFWVYSLVMDLSTSKRLDECEEGAFSLAQAAFDCAEQALARELAAWS